MRLVRFLNESADSVTGILDDDLSTIYEISSVDSSLKDVMTICKAAKLSAVAPSEWIQSKIGGKRLQKYVFNQVELLTPVEALEVWACGVTYQRSRVARNLEMGAKEAEETCYDKVYRAERPEIFMKSNHLRTRAPRKPLHLRADSKWLVPEPELCLVLSSDLDIIGYTIGNDLSSRDIEGENPLYLPQAKIWKGSCSFGPSILLAEAVPNPYELDIICRIVRDRNVVFEGTANTSQLNRTFEHLISYFGRYNEVFDGTVLMTGTCIVPPDEFTLQSGDTVLIEIPPIGVLSNPITEV